jgi:hypothetical protein
MCGIVGYITAEKGRAFKSDYLQKKGFIEQALIAGQLRGTDSTGVFAIPNGKWKDIKVFKRAMNSSDFVDTGGFKDIAHNVDDYGAVIGHNRKKTMGPNNNLSAHPFHCGNIIMVHNGTLDNHKSLPKGYDYEVDSEALCNSLDEWGVDKTLGFIRGAFTLVWYDTRDKKIHIVRNEERPLALGYAKEHNTVYMASEGSMLKWLANRNGIELDRVAYPKSGHLFSFDMTNPQEPEHREVALSKKSQRVYPGGKRSTVNNGKTTITGGTKGKGDGMAHAGVVAQVLNDYKLKVGYRVRFVLDNMQCVLKNEGHMYGYPTSKENDFFEVVAYNQPSSNQIHVNEEFSGEICSAARRKNELDLIILKNVLKEEPKGKKPEPDKSTESKGQEDKSKESKKDEVLFLPGPDADTVIGEQEWMELTRGGCTVCGDVILIDEAEDIKWIDKDLPLCVSCAREGTPEVEINDHGYPMLNLH